MLGFFNSLVSSFHTESQRQTAGLIALQKIFEKKVDPMYSEELSVEYQKLGISSTICFFGTVAGSFYFLKRLSYRIFTISAVCTVVCTWVWPYHIANMMEILAETPTDYGQTTRAVFIFKFNNGPKTQYYEKLSDEYRKYLQAKNRSNTTNITINDL